MRFHPNRTSCLLSGSTDGLVNIYNTAISDEDDALIHIMNHGSSINHAGFLTDTEVFALSHDENFSIYHVDDPSDAMVDVPPVSFGNLRSRLGCEYVVDLIPSSNVEAVVGAGSHRHVCNFWPPYLSADQKSSTSGQHLDLVPLNLDSGWSFTDGNLLRLEGAHGEEIVRSMCFDPGVINANDGFFNGCSTNLKQAQAVYTGGEDGLVRVWRMPANTESSGVKTHDQEKAAKKLKKRKGNDIERTRFQPY